MNIIYNSDGTVEVDAENTTMQELVDEMKVIASASYDKGRYENPSMFEEFTEQYYKQQKLDQDMRKAELELKIMDIDRIAYLEKELSIVKDKYIKLLETVGV